MLILYKHVKGINVKEGEELFKIKTMLAQEQMCINWLWIKIDGKLEESD